MTKPMVVEIRRAFTGEPLERHTMTYGGGGWAISFISPSGDHLVIDVRNPEPEQHAGDELAPELAAVAALQTAAVIGEDWQADELLSVAVQAATRALDRAHADGLTVPPQAAMGVAYLDTTARLLAVQNVKATRRDHS